MRFCAGGAGGGGGRPAVNLPLSSKSSLYGALGLLRASKSGADVYVEEGARGFVFLTFCSWRDCGGGGGGACVGNGGNGTAGRITSKLLLLREW